MTPDLAELRRLYEEAMRVDSNEMAWDGWTVAISEAAEDLFDAAAERDALAAKVERVRALPAKHPAGGWYMTSMRDVLAALDEEPQS